MIQEFARTSTSPDILPVASRPALYMSFLGLSTQPRRRVILRSSRLQSPPARPRSSSNRSPLAALRAPNWPAVGTSVARIRYEQLRLATLAVPENFRAPWGERANLAFRKVISGEGYPPACCASGGGSSTSPRGFLALSASHVKGR